MPSAQSACLLRSRPAGECDPLPPAHESRKGGDTMAKTTPASFDRDRDHDSEKSDSNDDSHESRDN